MKTARMRHELARTAPFPFTAIFQNGPRHQGSASPRKTGAPLTAPGRSENLSQTRERGRVQSPYLNVLKIQKSDHLQLTM